MWYDGPYGRGEAQRASRRYGAEFGGRRPRSRQQAQARPSRRERYGRDYWWLGEHEMQRDPRANRYDEYDMAFRRFSENNQPRYTPVGGMYQGIGGGYRPPRPVREPQWMSEWTRWF